MKRLFSRWIVLAAFFCVIFAGAAISEAACTGSSPSWSCSSWADLKTLVEGASIQTGDTATLAAGTHTYTSLITIPDSKRITITGVGTTCPNSCSTKVSASSSNMFAIGSSRSRIANIEFNFSACTGNIITTRHKDWRVDHNRFMCPLGGTKVVAVWASNSNCYHPTCQLGGLIDNNYFQQSGMYSEGNGASSDGLGAAAMAQFAVPFTFGDENAVYVEDNTFVMNAFGHVFDVSYGGAYVLRFNHTIKTNDGPAIETGSMYEGHGLMDVTKRGPRRFEVYWNTGNIEEGDTGYYRGGTGVIWGNRLTATLGGLNYFRFDHRRTPEVGDAAVKCDGYQPNYDGNDGPAAAPGWLCRDQIGAGADKWAHDGTLPLPDQYSMPAYTWDNGASGVYVVSGHTDIIKADRDWYNHSAATGSPQTTGVRVGPKAAMPAGCTAGVGYWVTDEGFWREDTPGVAAGVLYKCTGNAWTLYYTPYTYPHPLRSGEDPVDPSPSVGCQEYPANSGHWYPGTYAAQTLTVSDVQQCMTYASANHTIHLKAGTTSWSSGVQITKGVKIIGAGTGCPTACTDATTIQISGTAFTGVASNWRISGITFEGSGSATYGAIYVNAGGASSATNWRVDNCHFKNNGARGIAVGAYASASGYGKDFPGLIDSNRFSNASRGKSVQMYGGSLTEHGSWDDVLTLGGSSFVFFEDNVIVNSTMPSGVSSFDSDTGGRMVIRYNTFTNGDISAHGIETCSDISASPVCKWRSTHGWEVYKNSFVYSTYHDFVINFRGGTGVVWGNTYTGTVSGANMVRYLYERGDITRTCLLNLACQGASPYDGNQSSKYGYICWQQIGATGSNGITPKPVYQWENSKSGVTGESALTETTYESGCNHQHVQFGRDILAATIGTTLPGTCATGAGFWRTDVGYWNSKTVGADGVLYKCTAPNTWTLHYVPYPYPHPMRSGLTAPTGLTVE